MASLQEVVIVMGEEVIPASLSGRSMRSAGTTNATRERFIGVSCAALSVLLFATFTLASRLGLSSSLRFPDLAALRFGIGGTLLLPVLLRGGLRGVAWRHALALAFCGGIGFALFAYAGFALAPAAHGAVLLHGTLPLFTHLVMRTTARPIGPRHRTAGVFLIASGVALMAWDSVTVASARQLLGDGFLLLASFCWSSYGVLSRRLDLPPATAAALVAVLSSSAFIPVYALWAGKMLFVVGHRELLLQAAVQGVLIGAVSIFVYTRAVAALGAATTAFLAAAVPCVTTLAAIPLLSEYPSTVALAGVGVVTLGMVVTVGLRKHQTGPAPASTRTRSSIPCSPRGPQPRRSTGGIGSRTR